MESCESETRSHLQFTIGTITQSTSIYVVNSRIHGESMSILKLVIISDCISIGLEAICG